MADTAAVTLMNRWRSRFEGSLIAIADSGSDECRRISNRMIDRKPGVIERCARARTRSVRASAGPPAMRTGALKSPEKSRRLRAAGSLKHRAAPSLRP
jgi:hypothetical protein